MEEQGPPESASPPDQSPQTFHPPTARPLGPPAPPRPSGLGGLFTSRIAAVLMSIVATIVVVAAHLFNMAQMADAGPSLLLMNATRTLAAHTEATRLSVNTYRNWPGPVRRLIIGGDGRAMDLARSAWDAYLREVHVYQIEYPGVASLARDVQLAAWGDDHALGRIEGDFHSVGREWLPPEYERLALDLVVDAAEVRARTLPATVLVIDATVVGLSVLLPLVGLIVALVWLRRDPEKTALGPEPALGRFGLGRGYAVFMTAMFIWTVVEFGIGVLYVMPPFDVLAEQLWKISGTIALVPVAILVYLSILRPQRITAGSLFVGHAPRWGWRLLAALLVVIAFDWSFSLALSGVTDAMDYVPPWYQSVSEELLFGDRLTVGLTLFGTVVVTPVIEELLFRGVLFTALRARMGVMPAAILSGIVFGGVHMYDIAGFIEVTWSGIVFAWVFERTRSLLPCMLAHGLWNLIACVQELGIRAALP